MRAGEVPARPGGGLGFACRRFSLRGSRLGCGGVEGAENVGIVVG